MRSSAQPGLFCVTFVGKALDGLDGLDSLGLAEALGLRVAEGSDGCPAGRVDDGDGAVESAPVGPSGTGPEQLERVTANATTITVATPRRRPEIISSR
jgi:hypothetical protein